MDLRETTNGVSSTHPDFLSGGGEMGARMRSFTWSATSLGPPENWPQALRTVVRLLLTTNHPAFIFWGTEHLCFYNDAYKASLGPEKHPVMLGARGREMWSEIWHIIGPQIEQVMAGEGATWHEDHLVPIIRNGRLEEVYWTYSYSPIDHDDGVGGVLVLCNETTQRVLAEKRRIAELDRLRELFQQAPSFVTVLTGPEHRFEFLNDAYQRLIGPRQVVGRSVAEALPEVVGQGFVALLDEVYRSGESFIGQGTRLLLERSPESPPTEVAIDFIYKAIRDPGGMVTGIFVEGYDVTERTQAERALRESEGRLSTVLESVSDVFYALDGDWRFVVFNTAAERFFGKRRGEVLGRVMQEVFPEAVGTVFEKQYQTIMEGGPAITFESRSAARPDHVVEMRAAPLVTGGVAVAFSDITERKRAEGMASEQHGLLEKIALTRPLGECLTSITKSISVLQPGITGAILTTDNETQSFAGAYSAKMPPAFGEGIRNLPITDMCIGSCGESLFRGEAVASSDIANDRNWSEGWRQLCVSHGVAGCHLQPVIDAAGHAVAAIMLCFSEARATTAWERQISGFAASLAAIAIERNRAEEIIRLGEARLAAALKAGHLGVHEFYPRSGIVRWDDFVRSIWGVGTDEEITYDTFRNGVVPADMPGVEAALARALDPAGDRRFEGTYHVRNLATGTIRLIAADAEVEFDNRGARRLIGTLRDITESRAAEAQLRESEQRFRALADAMPQLVWTATGAGEVDYYNERHTHYAGLKKNEQGRWNWAPIVHPDEVRATASAWMRAARSGEPYSFEHRLKSSNGEWRWHISRAEPERDGTGAIVKWYGTATDIHELKSAEARLKELNETLEARVTVALAERKLLADIVESTDVFVQVSGLDFRFIAINRASADEFERIYGIRPKVGDHMLELLADRPEHRDAVEAVWSRALAGEEFTETTAFGDPQFGRRFYEMKFSVLRDRDGKRVGAYQFVYDVTKRLEDQESLAKAQEALRQAQKMEALGQLTGGVAHDFNNMLMAISGGLHMLERQKDAERQRRITAGMKQALDRGAGLTRQLLAFSRRRPLEAKPIDLADQIRGMSELLERSLGGNMQLEISVPPERWPVELDPGELELAILNICVNARDAMPTGGTIFIDVRNVHPLDGLVKGRAVRIIVRDAGTGMDAETLSRVFEPFFTTKDVGKGSGLGLAQVYAFVSQSAGEVSIQSALGSGTTVTLTFPATDKPIAPSEAIRPIAPLANASRVPVSILLVEDDPIVAEVTSELLQGLGYEVAYAPSAAAALALLEKELKIDIVLTDVMMPGGMSGIELARKIRSSRAHLPIVLTTGYSEGIRGIEQEDFAVLLKPYEIEELAEILASRLESLQDDAQARWR